MSKRKKTKRKRSVRCRVHEMRNAILRMLEEQNVSVPDEALVAGYLAKVLDEMTDLFDLKYAQLCFEESQMAISDQEERRRSMIRHRQNAKPTFTNNPSSKKKANAQREKSEVTREKAKEYIRKLLHID